MRKDEIAEFHSFDKVQRDRSSYGSCSVKIGVLKDFAKFTAKHLCQSLLFNKVAGLRLWCLPVNLAKPFGYSFYRTPPVAASILIAWKFRHTENSMQQSKSLLLAA